MSKKAKRRELYKRLVKIGAIVLVLVAAIGAGALVFWLQSPKQQTDSPSNSSENVNPITGLEDKTPPVIKEAQDIAVKGNIEESNKKLDEALRNTNSSEDKYNIYLQQGINYANQKNYQKALDSLKLACAQQETTTCYKMMGEMALLLDKKIEAKTHFEKAISLLDEKSPLYLADKTRLENKIKEIGG